VSLFVLEAAEDDDLDAILQIERRSFTHPWTLRGFKAAMADPARGRLVVLRRHGAEPGIVAYAAYEVTLDELHLHTLAVSPTARRLGLGRRLLEAVLDLGIRRGAVSALLEVRQSNWPALALYRSSGFETLYVRRDYYEHPREDALVLRKTDLRSGRGAAGGSSA
jgi:ribosomal-protein-alanine N-acetyltransferase